MDYLIYELTFSAGVHFGERALESSGISFYSDTLFSALCTEAVKAGEERLEKLVDYAKNGQILFSDAFPFVNKEYFIPKPFINIEKGEDLGNSSLKKRYKKLTYIPASEFSNYLGGDMDIKKGDLLSQLGISDIKVSALISSDEDTVPYRIGTFLFNSNAGLYFIVRFMDTSAEELFDTLIEELSYTGIGGRRSTGLGRFAARKKRLPDSLKTLFNNNEGRYMTMNLSLPGENELENVIKNSGYQLTRRSGFVYSDNYSNTPLKKKDMYAFLAGSVFQNKFEGDIYDVSAGGSHSVWRYAKPMFIRL
ncbi:MAG: type III-A CRISPR-associated RAMP protein Csm4 [Lachnospiraceae bacterium]|nr:type III-A CRISPR-associated RAMP protein Csm4 [Lachnospiraceae bacterium]